MNSFLPCACIVRIIIEKYLYAMIPTWAYKKLSLHTLTVRFTSMNPVFFEKAICWFSHDVFELGTNPIPRAFRWIYQIFTLANLTADIQQNMNLSHLFHLLVKVFAFEKFWKKFHQISSFRYLLWIIRRHLNISSKNGHQSMDSFYCSQFSANIDLTIDLLQLQPK